MLASCPASMLNQISLKLGIPFDSFLSHPALGENPARWRGHLDKIFPARAKLSPVAHHDAVSIDDLPATYASLCKSSGLGALALRFAILTAARAGEATGAT